MSKSFPMLRRASARGLLSMLPPLLLVACGGGGGEDAAGSGGPGFVSWNGSNNGSTVLADGGVRVRFSDDSYMYIDDVRYTNVVVLDGQVLLDGKPYARIVLAPAEGNGQVAVMQCLGTTQLVKISGGVLSCPPATDPGSGGSGGAGGSGSGGSGTGGGGSGTPEPPAPIACAPGGGNGTNGLAFYNPSSVMRYTLSTTSAGVTSQSMLSWGAQFQSSGAGAGSYSGSLRARLWALDYSYTGGNIRNSIVLGTFEPRFTGSGARSPNQIVAGGYSTTDVQSSDSATNPARGSYCIVATLEEFQGGTFVLVDWRQFPGSVAFL